MKWVILTSSGHAALTDVFGDCHIEAHQQTNRMRTFDRIEDARERKAGIKAKWPFLKVWIVELPAECTCMAVIPESVAQCDIHKASRTLWPTKDEIQP